MRGNANEDRERDSGDRGRRRELEGYEEILRGREGEARKKGKKEAGERESLREGVFGEKNMRLRERERGKTQERRKIDREEAGERREQK